MGTWDTLKESFDSGKSVRLFIIILVISIIVAAVVHQCGNPAKQCWYRSDNVNPLHEWRGKDYFALDLRDGDSSEDQEEFRCTAQKCIVTLWNLMHMIMWVIIGFVAPKLIGPFILLGIVWELFEYISMDCHCVMDVGWNIVGLAIGVGLRQALFPVC